MATWTVGITPVSAEAKTVDVHATAVDAEGRTFNIDRQNVYIGTAAAKTVALDELYGIFVAARNKAIAEETYIGALEDQAKTTLEARTP